jgi:hypothetical protein
MGKEKMGKEKMGKEKMGKEKMGKEKMGKDTRISIRATGHSLVGWNCSP